MGADEADGNSRFFGVMRLRVDHDVVEGGDRGSDMRFLIQRHAFRPPGRT